MTKQFVMHKYMQVYWMMVIVIVYNITLDWCYSRNFQIKHLFIMFFLSYLTFSASKYFHCSICQNLEIIPCFTFKCDSSSYFIYIYPNWRIISDCFKFLWYTQNNIIYLIQNMMHQVIQIYHSILELIS